MSDRAMGPSHLPRKGREVDRFGEREECLPAGQGIGDRIGRMTPTDEQLLELAKRNPPADEWLSADEECPFWL
jgi:hypothetical protein